MKKKLSIRIMMSFGLSVILFCMPVGAFMANRQNTVEIHAQAAEPVEENREEADSKSTDLVKPTLNAAISDEVLSIQAHDTDSGIKVIYVNGYEFTDPTNGALNIRLQQFDAGYQHFTIQAMDYAGNMSEIYRLTNPYYTDEDSEESTESSPAEQLPVSASATAPSSASGQVTEHVKSESNDENTDDFSLDSGESAGEKEFYTIQTASEKVFYLIIDRDGDEEVVYFLTEVSERDLLNATAENSETLPKNSAALESAIPISDSALPNNNGQTEQVEETEEVNEETTEEEESEKVSAEPATEENPMVTYLLLGAVAVAAIGIGYYLKMVRKKKEDFLDEDDEEDDEEEYIEEDEDADSEDDFFETDENEEEE